MSTEFEETNEQRLQDAEARHVKILYQLNIRTYGDLQQFGVHELLRLMRERLEAEGLAHILPESARIRRWLIQANAEHPGTIITRPSPGGIDERPAKNDEEEEAAAAATVEADAGSSDNDASI